jgi:hypothetical protein
VPARWEKKSDKQTDLFLGTQLWAIQQMASILTFYGLSDEKFYSSIVRVVEWHTFLMVGSSGEVPGFLD